MPYRSGRHFLQIPGPTNVPDRVLRAIDRATMDHRGPEFGPMGLEILEGLKNVFQTRAPVVIYPASGTGAWEAALVNTLSPGERVLMFETGHFASLWHKMATKLGLSVNCVSEKALKASRTAAHPRSYWNWDEMLSNNKSGYSPYTPATNLLYGLRESLAMLEEEGLQNVFARHARHAESTRRAVRAWGLEILCAVPEEYSNSLTAVMMPAGHDADALRKIILEAYDMSLGTGLGKLAGKVFRIGHLGDFNDLMLAGTLAGIEMGLALANVPHKKGGVLAALDHLAESARAAPRKAA